MLRRKLLIILGPLVALLVTAAIIAIVLLQDVLRGVEHISGEAIVIVDRANELGRTISRAQIELYRLRTGAERHLDALLDTVESMQAQATRLGQHYVIREEGPQQAYARILQRLPVLARRLASLATAQDPDLSMWYNQQALEDAAALRQDMATIGDFAAQHAQEEQTALANRFKWLVLGLALIFLVVINISVLALLRIAGMILRPVDKLVEAAGKLAQERFDTRVSLDQRDEFDQLARAYNSMAEQLQAAEQRRLETMAQVSLTLNHELNNAAAIIEMQLGLLSRQAGGNPGQEKCLHQIRQGLSRMSQTLELLKRVRRIVLTDYVPGTKMLDLEQSAKPEETAPVRT